MRGIEVLLLIGAAVLLFLFTSKGQQGENSAAQSGAGDNKSMSDAVRSKGTLDFVLNGWTPGFSGEPGTCPPNAMC